MTEKKNLDDNYEELTNPNYKEELEKFVMTPRGLFLISMFKSVELATALGIEDPIVVMKIADEVWMNFENEIRKNFGKGANSGAVVFDVHGGTFLTIEESDTEEDDEKNDIDEHNDDGDDD